MTNTTTQFPYGVCITGGTDVSDYHPVIMNAIANGGVFDEDFADIFKLTKTPEGSAVAYVLTFA